jgi:hypothetical protein
MADANADRIHWNIIRYMNPMSWDGEYGLGYVEIVPGTNDEHDDEIESREVAPGVVVDFGLDSEVLGIEFLSPEAFKNFLAKAVNALA